MTTPGKDHSSHRLARLTRSLREAVLICYLATGACGMVGIFITAATVVEGYAVGVGMALIGLGALWWFEERVGFGQ